MITLKKIVCPIDHSKCSEEAFKYAAAFALKDNAKLYLLHVIDTRVYDYDGSGMVDASKNNIDKGIVEDIKKKLLESVPKEIRNTIEVEAKVAYGHPFAEIINLAKEEKADMIIMGTHGRSGFIHAMMNSVAEKVVRKAPCPVLCVREIEKGRDTL